MLSDDQPPFKRTRLTAHCSPSDQQQPPQADPSTQQHQQRFTQLQSEAEPQLAQKESGANSEQQDQQQQQLPEQLLQQLTQHAQFPQQLLDQVEHLQQHGQQLLHQHQKQHNQQHNQQQQTQSPGHDAQPHACHSPMVGSHLIAGATCLLHMSPSRDTIAMPTAGKDDNADLQQQQQQQHAQSQCSQEHLVCEQHGTAAATGTKQVAEGVWQVLLQAAVAHEEEVCQELIEQCRQEEMDVTPGLKLASGDQFEELALMVDFSLSNLSLAGKIQAPVCNGHRAATGVFKS